MTSDAGPVVLALRRISAATGLDRPVTYTLLTRAWQAVAGVVTIVLIAKNFTPEVQGFFYTFASLVALQIFLELGLNVVIVNRASQEWGLMQFVSRWYAALSVLFIGLVGVAGYLFLRQSPQGPAGWEWPWFSLVVLVGVQLWLTAALALLEGCNQVATVNRFRLWQAVAEAVTAWGLLAAGTGLWVAVGAAFIKVAAGVLLLATLYRKFIASLLATDAEGRFSWKTDIWPLQGRIAAQASVNYFAFSLYTPVMFHYHGASVAGQMGMTLQIVNVIHMIAMAWVLPKQAVFGMYAAKREYPQLDAVWGRALKHATTVNIVASSGVLLCVAALMHIDAAMASRLLPLLPVALFLAANVLQQVSYCQAIYLRAHAREPLLAVGVSGGLYMGTMVWWLGSLYGALGAAAASILVTLSFSFPVTALVWHRLRHAWHSEPRH
jgi:hypothetical protein